MITVPAGESKNNTNTATPFVIPATTGAIYLLAGTDGIRYRSRPDAASPSSVAATSTDFPLKGGQAFGESFGASYGGGAARVVACWNTTGGSIDVDVFGVNP